MTTRRYRVQYGMSGDGGGYVVTDSQNDSGDWRGRVLCTTDNRAEAEYMANVFNQRSEVTTATIQDELWLFVYGTLRPDGQLHSLLRPGAVVGFPVDRAEATGALYHVVGGSARSPIYPVADFEQEGTVVGTLLLVRTQLIRYVRNMELNVGYEERMIDVRHPLLFGGSVRALAYHHPDRAAYGPRITSGDWRRL